MDVRWEGSELALGSGDDPRPSSVATPATLARLARGEPCSLVLADRYRIEAVLGRGGMGSVFLARHVALDRPVAIKVLDPAAPGGTGAIARFIREARLAARVRHHNIVDVHDFGSTPEGVVYLVMEALRGRDLRALVHARGSHARGSGGSPSWAWTLHVMQQVCAGVEAIHRTGVVHRDLKASNCFLVEATRQVKVLDFGIAIECRAARTGRSSSVSGSHAEGGHAIVGTPESMAPEQIRGQAPDPRMDVYAAGVLLFELLTGRPPFQGRSAEEVFEQHLASPIPCLRALGQRALDPHGLALVDAVLGRALAKEPSRRFPSMAAFAHALTRTTATSPLRRLFTRTGASTSPLAFESP